MTIGHIGTATKAESEQEMPATQWGVFCCMCIYMLARTWSDITHSYCKQFLFYRKGTYTIIHIHYDFVLRNIPKESNFLKKGPCAISI